MVEQMLNISLIAGNSKQEDRLQTSKLNLQTMMVSVGSGELIDRLDWLRRGTNAL